MCAWIFGDSFDCYKVLADAGTYWDAVPGNGSLTAPGSGRFTGSQGYQFGSGASISYFKNGANDALHHLVFAVTTTNLAGTDPGGFFVLGDGANAQCTVVFRSDGAIYLTTGGVGGAAIATYTGAITATNTWFAFEVEVFISSTAGYMNVRKNGATSNSFTSATNLNTRAGSTNNYANRLSLGGWLTTAQQTIDDLLWRSDAATVPWVGDVRAYVRMPSSVASAQFTAFPVPLPVTVPASTVYSEGANFSRYVQFTATATGTVGTITVNFNPGFTGNAKVALFSNASNLPGAILGTANVVANPITGDNTFTFSSPVSVTQGTIYWYGCQCDSSHSWSVGVDTVHGVYSTSITYASFPTANPSINANSNVLASTVNITAVNAAGYVSEPQQDGTGSYVFDSTVGHNDLYGIGSIAIIPAAVVAVTTRGFFEKSDAGARSGAVQLKSGSSTVQSTSTALATTFGWLWRTDTVDPATSAAWTPAAVNAVTIGPVVTA